MTSWSEELEQEVHLALEETAGLRHRVHLKWTASIFCTNFLLVNISYSSVTQNVCWTHVFVLISLCKVLKSRFLMEDSGAITASD